MEFMHEGWSLDRFEAGSRGPRPEVTFVAPLAQWNRNCNDIADGVTFTTTLHLSIVLVWSGRGHTLRIVWACFTV